MATIEDSAKARLGRIDFDESEDDETEEKDV
jgi:hypothetical protein